MERLNRTNKRKVFEIERNEKSLNNEGIEIVIEDNKKRKTAQKRKEK